MMRLALMLRNTLTSSACALTLCLVSTALSVAPGCNAGSTAEATVADPHEVTLDGRTYALELALTPEQREQGLSDREEIDPEGGMLFVFPDSQVHVQQFVMRRCLVPIDIIFVAPDGLITAMHAMQVEEPGTTGYELERYGSRYPAQFVIELAGGTLETLNLSVGDRVDLPREALAAAAN